MMKSKIFQLIIFLLFFSGHCQKTEYSFKDTTSLNKPIDIVVNTIHPNIKKYRGLFNYKGLQTITFKTINEKWYIKIDKKWYLFFNNGEKSNIIFSSDKFIFKTSWIKTDLKLKTEGEIFEFKLVPINFTMSGNTKYYFTPNLGFIAIKSHDGFFVRNDIEL